MSGPTESPVTPSEPPARSSVSRRAIARVRTELSSRLTPERTRRATLTERLTVSRLSWETCVRLNRYLEFFGRVTTVIYAAFVVTLVFGVDWKTLVESTFNSGAPVRGAIALVVILVTLFFVALHSMIGWGRWRLQRELWRRDVATVIEQPAGGSGDPSPPGTDVTRHPPAHRP
ncbi:MAG: hypothetical protein KDB58_02355 [Solirubrobacterales bacterium]|nr:hypothetical protein [Solirubrobacterales bacterium]MCB8971471.1 hypothetical protein [Thermoleophilales bacterium]MCO5327116.1 hypothetical protein [Solirubrobacterales bacterium]